MESRWLDDEAAKYVERYAPTWGEALALRVYTSHLIGSDPDLVLHGGGNTSVKGAFTTLLGDRVDALWVKGSGSDLDRIEPPGFPALDLAYLRRLRSLDALDDREMVNQLRTHLFDASAPNPSVETLSHAFLPHPWVDHTHADAILALTNQPRPEQLVRAVLGPKVGIVPYVMPGLRLAKAAVEVYERDPEVEALVLVKHGLFTFGEDARTSYQRTIRCVDLAERHLRRAGAFVSLPACPSPDVQRARSRWPALAPITRGLLAQPTGDADRPWRRQLLEFRSSPEILALLDRPEAAAQAGEGPLTPDHAIRTKGHPLSLPTAADAEPDAFRQRLAAAVDRYRADYDAYFARQTARTGRSPVKLSSDPAVLLLPGLGLVGVGPSARDAAVVADIAEHTLRIKAAAATFDRYEGLAEDDLFDMEYWSLEQAKLGRGPDLPLAGQVALVTGGAGAIGVGIAGCLLAAGAHVALADLDAARLGAARERLAGRGAERLRTVACDVADEGSLHGAVDGVLSQYGGLDICVANAGLAAVALLAETSTDTFRRLQDVNTLGYFLTIREAARVMIEQGTGGSIIVNASKNVFAPGSAFGAYSASKAAGHQLGKVAALELAQHGIRVNMINADAVFGDAATPSRLWQAVGPDRARARGLTQDELESFYRQRNLLKTTVLAEHVGNAVVFFASNLTPTTGATLPVDGGLPEAFPR